MSIISITPGQTGLVGVLPSVAYINTNDTIAEVTVTGYLNREVANGIQFSLPCIAAVSTQTSPTAAPVVAWYQVQHVSPNWSLVGPINGSIALPSGDIFVGNVSGIATAVAMSGAATLSNTGVLTLSAGSVDLTNLAAGLTPSSIVKFSGTNAYGGGSASTTITVTGMLATDLPFVQIQASTTAVTVEKVTPSSNTITILMSGDPGAATTFSYQVLRVPT